MPSAFGGKISRFETDFPLECPWAAADRSRGGRNGQEKVLGNPLTAPASYGPIFWGSPRVFQQDVVGKAWQDALLALDTCGGFLKKGESLWCVGLIRMRSQFGRLHGSKARSRLSATREPGVRTQLSTVECC